MISPERILEALEPVFGPLIATETPTDDESSLAGLILSEGHPLDDDQTIAAIAGELIHHGFETALAPDQQYSVVRVTLRSYLGQYLTNARSLAGSLLRLDPRQGPNRG